MRARLNLILASLGVSSFLVAQGHEAESRLDNHRREYAVLASNLVPSLGGGAPSAEVDMEPAVIEARERWRVITLAEIDSRNGRIRAVAKEAAAAHDAILSVARDSEDMGILIDLGMALCTSNPLPLLKSVASEASKSVVANAKYANAVQRRRAATFLLPELARELCGPVSENPVLEIDFDENWFGSSAADRVNLTNTAASALTNCTVQIDIRGANGKWVRNIHFVASWNPGQRMWADYFSTDPTHLASISGTTATEVQDIKVQVWCNELRSEAVLHYPGPARDADRVRLLEQMLSFEVDYVGQPLFEQGPCIGVTLGGVGQMRACKVVVLCRGGSKVDQQLEATLPLWEKGQRISLQSRGALNTCPESVEVTVTCEGIEKGVTKRVVVGRRR